MPRREKTCTAWAIDLRYLDHESWSLTGVFWFRGSAPDPWHDGCRTALFRTRAAARAHLKERVRRGRVVKVSVLIREATA